jgi:hypothetical protein
VIWWALDIAVTFTWLGMVLAISFLEAPLKFRAPGVTVQIGLGIGQLVFRALNTVEVVLGLVVIAAMVGGAPAAALWWSIAALVALAAQLLFVRPRLRRRSAHVLAGGDADRSHAHVAYIALETVKVLALVGAGVVLLAATF